MSSLTERLERAYGHPQASADFDLPRALDEVLGCVGLSSGDAGGAISHVGADPVVKSPLRLGAAAAIGLLAKSVAAAALHRWRGGAGQDISVDLRRAPHRLSPFYDFRWERLGGYPVRSSLEAGNMMSAIFYRTADERWVMPQAMYPNLRQRAQDLLGIPLTWPAISEAIGKWNGLELEAAGEAAGIVMPMVRTLPEFLKERQYREVLAKAPLIDVIRIGDSAREPLHAAGDQPFSGYRALGMGHVVAGAGLGRSLALHGADVLNLWRPGEGEQETIYASSNVGIRSAWLDPRADRARLGELLAEADIFFHNRRPAFLREIELTPEAAARQLDAEGFLYVTDRKKDMILSGGENIASSEIERVVQLMPGVSEVAVVGLPDERWGEVPVAVVVPHAGAMPTSDALIEHCRAHLAGFKVPRRLVIRDRLPRNPSGKVLKRDLRSELANLHSPTGA